VSMDYKKLAMAQKRRIVPENDKGYLRRGK
jgi:hypothetical protein